MSDGWLLMSRGTNEPLSMKERAVIERQGTGKYNGTTLAFPSFYCHASNV